MIFSMTFRELEGYLQKKLKRNINFSRVDDDTVYIYKKLNLLLVEKNVGVKITIEEFCNTFISMRYSGGIGASAVVKGGLKVVGFIYPEIKGSIKVMTGNRLLIDLKSISKIKDILTKIQLESLRINDQGIEIKFSLC